MRNTITLAELSKITGIKNYTLRYWDETDRLVPVYKTEKGFRYYSHSQILDALELKGERTIIAYSIRAGSSIVKVKEENDELLNEVQSIEPNKKVIGVYDSWTGGLEGTELENIIKKAVKGLVSKVYVQDRNWVLRGRWDEYQMWLSYMNCELINLSEIKGEQNNDEE